jgi:hypothetical protein
MANCQNHKARNHEARNRRRAQVAILACFCLPIAMVVACTQTERGLGEACLKGEDCTSGVCVAQVCSEAPPLIQGPSTTPVDAASEASIPTDATTDANESIDATSDAPVDDAADAAGD